MYLVLFPQVVVEGQDRAWFRALELLRCPGYEPAEYPEEEANVDVSEEDGNEGADEAKDEL